MANTTYSFADHIITISSPAYLAFPVNGQGIGECNVAYSDANSIQERSADGSVVTSKIVADNGTINMVIQQTSELNRWLLGLFNALYKLPSNYWTSIQISIRAINSGDTVICTGVCFERRGEKPYQAQAQMITWPFLATKISQNGSILQGLNPGTQPILNTSAAILNL